MVECRIVSLWYIQWILQFYLFEIVRIAIRKTLEENTIIHGQKQTGFKCSLEPIIPIHGTMKKSFLVSCATYYDDLL